MMQNPYKLRKLAAWYRQFAERAGNPVIWECRLLTAHDLDAEADHIERLAHQSGRTSPDEFEGARLRPIQLASRLADADLRVFTHKSAGAN